MNWAMTTPPDKGVAATIEAQMPFTHIFVHKGDKHIAMKTSLFRFALYAIIVYITLSTPNPAVAASESSAGNGTHFCGVTDNLLTKQFSDQFPNRRYARSFAANLNIGEPRTVRMIYFLPNDRPYRPNVVQKMKDEIRSIQTFYAEQMESHGYGRRTFRVETDAQGEPMVHRVEGRYPDSHYVEFTEDTVRSEIYPPFDIEQNVYLVVIDNSIDGIGYGESIHGGAGRRPWKNGGDALVSGEFEFGLVAHELGHAFGLDHDFSDGAYIMSYGPGQTRLSACHAEYLFVHPYFNLDIPIDAGDRPTVELISPRSYPASSQSVLVRVKVNDSDGLHQVILYAAQPDNRRSVKACRGLGGKKEVVIEFDYDGVIPSAHDPAYSRNTSLLNPLIHPIIINPVDMNGNTDTWGSRRSRFFLFSEALEPLTKISGDNLQGLPNTPLPAPFVVELRDLNDGSARRGVPVTFTVTEGGGTLSVERAKTNHAGRAESMLTLGPNLETNTVEVYAEGHTVTFNAVVGAPVDIPDTNLRAAIEDALDKSPGTPIAPAEIATLTHLEARNANISDLTGLEHATNLTFLDISDNRISDISPVAGLINLTLLDLDGNALSDISPVAGLTNLTFLDIWRTPISDISPIVGLINLTVLGLGYNSISDLSPLIANTELGEGDKIYVRGNPLSYQSIHTHIPTLQSRGVTVEFDADGTRPPDVNGDGSVNVLDLLVIVSKFGDTGTHIATDISGDGVVDIMDLVLVAGMFQDTAAAPSTQSQASETLTAVEVQGWLTDARFLEIKDTIMKRGIMVLEQLLVSLTPKETELLANYPNPFNPETWIPYRLAEDAFVTLTIYDLSGRVVRFLDVGHRIASAYESRSKAVYWDGRNGFGEQVASGVHFYTLTAGGYSATRRLVILK